MKRTFYSSAPLTAALCAMLFAPAAVAAVTAEEAQQLKTTLTPMGAERAGNKGGSIPEWTGGFTTVDPGRKPGDRRYDPFAEDKPLFSITAENADKYTDKLADGVVAMLKTYPKSFKINVYPTRRTAAAPQRIYDSTFQNATSAHLEKDGVAIRGAKAGVPFPIPKTGEEIRWNHITRWHGEAIDSRYKVWSITSDGTPVLASQGKVTDQWPFYYKDNPVETEYQLGVLQVEAPAFRVGEALLLREPNDFSDGRHIWQYLSGQRRVRRAPTIGYDTPDFVASGTNFFDEAQGMLGSPERYDFKLVGKKEMYIPYNTNRLFMHKDQEVMDTNHLKPEFVRWELHRVWVVEATLKSGRRHAVPRRVSYHDEDTWSTAIMDGWDPQGKLWRTNLTLPFVAPDIPAVVNNCTDNFFNHQTKAWVYHCSYGDSDMQYMPVPVRQDSYFTPEALNGLTAR